MSKKSLARLIRIITGTFGSAKDESFSLDTSLTKFERFVHFWVLVWRSFVRNRCPIRASALSFVTLLALIPTIAVAMSVSSALLKTQGEDKIKGFVEQFIDYMIPSDADTQLQIYDEESWYFSTNDVSSTLASQTNAPSGSSTNSVASDSANDGRIGVAKKRAADYIYKFIQNTYSGSLGTFGVLFLFWTTIITLTRVEETFNDIWGVTRGRDWWSRITNYFTTVILIPVLIIVALGLSSGPHFAKTRDMLNVVPFLVPLVSQLLPVLVICITFALLYKSIPNTRVHFSAALVGGAIAGTAWHLFNILSLHVASRAVSASKIYGSLALVPLLMVGLYTVWVIVLFGAQVAYAFQNRESYLQERIAENVNQRGREFVALRLMTCIGQRFDRGLKPATVREMSNELGIPSKLVAQVLHTLLAAHIVVEVTGVESGFAPARPLDTINCHHILLAMRATQGQELVTREEPVREEVFGEFARIQAAEKEAASSVSMLALVNRAHARLQLAPPEPKQEISSVTKVVEVTELPHEPATATSPELAITEKESKSKSSLREESSHDDQSFPL